MAFCKRLRYLTSLFLLPISLAYANPLPPQVHVKASERGQAILYQRLNNCYAITPTHVMGSDYFASLVGAGRERRLGSADLLQSFGYDLSILFVSGPLAEYCGTNLEDIPDVDRVLNQGTRAVVSSVDESGSVTRRTQTVVDKDIIYFRMRPQSEEDRLFQGMSGSLVIINENAAGVLQSVDPATGEGTVLRLDRALEIVRPFFQSSYKAPASQENTAITAGLSSADVTVVDWSELPTSAEHRAELLSSSALGEGYWQASANFPQSISFQLSENEPVVIDGITLESRPAIPKSELVKDVEILASIDGKRWNSVGAGTFISSKDHLSIRFPSGKYRFVRVKIYSNWGAGFVALGSVKINLAN